MCNRCIIFYAHIDKKPFHCSLCSASFTRIQRLNKHLREKHPGAREVTVKTYKPPPFRPKPQVPFTFLQKKKKKQTKKPQVPFTLKKKKIKKNKKKDRKSGLFFSSYSVRYVNPCLQINTFGPHQIFFSSKPTPDLQH